MVKSERPLVHINEALRKAAAGRLAVATGGAFGLGEGKIPRTFYVGTGSRTNDKGEFRLATVLEVTAPEITPEDLDMQKLYARFHNGLIYTTYSAIAEGIVSGEIRSQSIMRANIPRFLLEKLEAGDLDILKGSFKHVSIGFIDLKSSTAMCGAFAKKGAADDYNTLIRKLLAKLKEEVEAQKIDVVLLKYIGDCIMFVTGIPQQKENDHGNIIRAAIAMKRANKKLNADPEAQAIYEKHRDVFRDKAGRLTPASFCTGIMSGEVFAGDIFHKEIDYRSFLTDEFLIDHQIVYDLIGDPVNVAARLEAAAGAWHILINLATIEGAKREGSLQAIVDEYNSYCLNLEELKERLLIPYYQKEKLDSNLLDQQLEEYRRQFTPLTFEDMSTPCVVQGKGMTDIERAVYFRWDIRPLVLKRLSAVGIKVPEDDAGSHTPSVSEILAADYSDESPASEVIARLKEYINYIGCDRLRLEADLIGDRTKRIDVLKNISYAMRK